MAVTLLPLVKGKKKLKYRGTASSLAGPHWFGAAASVGSYAIFAGGSDGDSILVAKAEAYSRSLTRTDITDLTFARRGVAATSVGSYAIFAGGSNLNSTLYLGAVDVYNSSLVRTSATTLSNGRSDIAATTVGDYALFSGGSVYGQDVDAYNSSLTHTKASSMSISRIAHSAATIGEYAIFAGSVSSATVDVYNASLTRTTAEPIAHVKIYMGSASTSSHALFAGGNAQGDQVVSTINSIDAYDSSLSHTTLKLSDKREQCAGASLNEYAIFAGGVDYQIGSMIASAEAVDTALTRMYIDSLSEARSFALTSTIGNYAIFGGGLANSGVSLNVDVYQYK